MRLSSRGAIVQGAGEGMGSAGDLGTGGVVTGADDGAVGSNLGGLAGGG